MPILHLTYNYGSIGSVVALLNNSGSVVEGYSYDPFGKPTVHTAAGSDGKWLTSDDTTAANPVSAYGNWQMFTARQWDKESGLYYYRARMYHPQLGRFLQPDPIGYYDSMNLYQYCGNNPMDWVDPWGLKRASIGKLHSQIERGQAPRGVEGAHSPHTNSPGEKPHVHLTDPSGNKSAINNDGSMRHGEKNLTKDQEKWLKDNEWPTECPKK